MVWLSLLAFLYLVLSRLVSPCLILAHDFDAQRNRVVKEDGDPRWESSKSKRDDGLRDLGELFEEAPSVESYPEYHVKVKHIMDLKTIKKKVWGGGRSLSFCLMSGRLSDCLSVCLPLCLCWRSVVTHLPQVSRGHVS